MKRTFLLAACLPCLIVALGTGVSGWAYADDPLSDNPSGLPVPRWVTLKSSKINARSGPSTTHRILWQYRAKGLPVLIVSETREWRQICDPDGGTSWVQKNLLDGRRGVALWSRERLPLRAKAREEAEIRAYLRPRALASLETCKDGWCRIKVKGQAGWAPESALWGTASPTVCQGHLPSRS
ncbi:MAG: SH3 domain-containing protein [Asticcacaulis sp.]